MVRDGGLGGGGIKPKRERTHEYDGQQCGDYRGDGWRWTKVQGG